MTKNLKKSLYLLPLLLFLTGCITLTLNVSKDYSLIGNEDVGLVIVSLTQSGQRIKNHNYLYRGITNKIKGSLPATNIHINNDWEPSKTSPQVAYIGRLAVIELPKGEYEFYSWKGNIDIGITMWRIYSSNEFSFRFKVIPGRAVYIGNLDMYLDIEKKRSDIIIRNIDIKIYDMSYRDLILLYDKYPQIILDQVITDILKIGS